MKARWLYRGVGILAIATAAVAVFGFVVEGLWNGLMPSIFGWHTITFWQAVGLLLLSKILFGGGLRGRGKIQPRHAWLLRPAGFSTRGTKGVDENPGEPKDHKRG